MTRWKSRITVDVDGWGNYELRALRAYFEMLRMFERVEVRVSSSGAGLHLIGWTTEDISLEQRLDIRRYLGDDGNRVRMDAIRGRVGHTTDVCWTEKGGQEADQSFDDIEAALTHISAGEPPGERLRERVQNGWVV